VRKFKSNVHVMVSPHEDIKDMRVFHVLADFLGVWDTSQHSYSFTFYIDTCSSREQCADDVSVAVRASPDQSRQTQIIMRISRRATRQKPLHSIQAPSSSLKHQQSALLPSIAHARHSGPESCLYTRRAAQVLDVPALIRPFAAIMLRDDKERVDRSIRFVISEQYGKLVDIAVIISCHGRGID
jgi:hypothetical protein